METRQLAEQIGITVQMVGRLKARGMPTDTLENAIAWRKKNIDSQRTKANRIGGNAGVKAGKKGKTTAETGKSFDELQAEVSDSQLDLDTTNADDLYRNARALKEKALALQAASEHEKFIGELVLKKDVEKVIFVRCRQFRDGLMTLSRRLAPELASLSNINEIESLLDKEFRVLLEAFAKLPVVEE